MAIELTIPDLGDSTTTGIILSFLVEPGSKVSAGDNLIEVETDKVVMEVPTEQDGVINKFLLNIGDTVEMGSKFVEITPEQTKTVDESTTQQEKAPQVEQPKGVVQETQTQPIEKPEDVKATKTNAAHSHSQPKTLKEVIHNSNNASSNAGPSARRLARQLGIELSQVTGTGIRGRISRNDIKAFAKAKLASSDVTNLSSSTTNFNKKPLPDFSSFGGTHKVAASRIQQVTAENMSHSVQRVPHAWIQQEIDITDLENARKRHKEQVKSQGGSLTITAIMTKLLAKVIDEYPVFSASYDEDNAEFTFRDYRHIGIAVDTPRGLVVPVIKNVDSKSIVDLAFALNQTSQKAREGKLTPADMQGSVMTISNLGGLGVNGMMPVINWPEAAILGLTAAQWLPRLMLNKGEEPEMSNFTPRLIMNVSLAFDHRIINGADAARFLARLKDYCEDPSLLAFNL